MLIAIKQGEALIFNKVEISYSVNEKSFVSKPEKKEFVNLQFHRVHKPINELISHIESGKSFTCGIFEENKRENDSFIQQHILALDFDKGLPLAEAESILSDFNINYNFGYYTFNHTDEFPRFRLVFLIDQEISNIDVLKKIYDGFHKLFNCKTDKKCKDASRIFLGTRKKCFIRNLGKQINLLLLVEKLNLIIYTNDSNKTRNLIDFNKNSPNPGSAINVLNNKSRNSPKNDTTPKIDLPIIEKWKMEDLLQLKCFRLFYEGKGSEFENKLSHTELFGIATNLAKLKGGQKLFKQLLARNSNYNRDKYSIMSYVIKQKYYPQKFADFSPHEEDVNSYYQTFPQIVKKKGNIIVNTTPELISPEEAKIKFQEAFKSILNSDDDKIYIIKCAPGIGKTKMIKNQKGIVVAFPNHALKHEHYETSILKNEFEKIETPKLKGIFSPRVAEKLTRLYQCDLSKHVMINLKKLAEGKSIFEDGAIIPEDVKNANEYLNLMSAVRSSGPDKTIFTTHARAILSDFEHNTVIYDEDPINTILEQHNALKSELYKLVGILTSKNINCNELIKVLNQSDFDIPVKTPDFKIDRHVIEDIAAEAKFNSHVIKFFLSDSYCVNNIHIHYAINNSNKFVPGKKYVICDATSSIEIHKALFGDRAVVVDISNVKNKGTIQQFTKFSCSRQGLSSYGDKINEKINTTLPTITFKTEKHRFANSTVDMHFGNVRGYNGLTGKNINIVGTPHCNLLHYKFLSHSLNLNISDYTFKHDYVMYNDIRFKFNTFTDPILQKIHLEGVNAELTQAAHRPRLIWNDATVYLYSNFPLQQAIYHY